MTTYFNNCGRRDHAQLFGAGSFFDLNLHGRQATMATILQPGDACVVATPGAAADIEFAWYSFTHERILPDENGVPVRVLFGKHLRSDVLDRQGAVASAEYGHYFDVLGRFKRPSVIRAESARSPR